MIRLGQVNLKNRYSLKATYVPDTLDTKNQDPVARSNYSKHANAVKSRAVNYSEYFF